MSNERKELEQKFLLFETYIGALVMASVNRVVGNHSQQLLNRDVDKARKEVLDMIEKESGE